MAAELDLFTGLPQPHTGLQQWAEDARQAAAVAQSLAPTPFVPNSLRSTSRDPDEARRVTVGNITAAILTGQELGLTPMASLRSINIIQGTPAMTALALRGLVQSRGHEVRKVESSDTRCVYEGRRAGSDGPFERSVWTIDRARAMGLTGKDNWKRQPEAMLIARASSECAGSSPPTSCWACRTRRRRSRTRPPSRRRGGPAEGAAGPGAAPPRPATGARPRRRPGAARGGAAGRAQAHQPGQADRPQRRPHRRPRPHRPQRETCVAHRAPRP
jgi:hypothetical protein